MNILVTGGAGFIGSHLCDLLVSAGHHVLCLDNLFTGSRANIAHLLDRPNFEFIEHDIIAPYYADCRLDQIYNLACPASPVHYQLNAIRTIKANTIGVINVLGLAKKHGARVFQASTSEVYGDPQVHPQPESYRGNVNPTGPRACYDEGKRVAETLFFDYHRKHGLEIRVVRIFNTYGPRMAVDDGRVVSNFIIQALKNQDIAIYGDGTQTRAFCFVSDLVTGCEKMMSQENFVGPVNLGNPTELTVNEIADKILALTGSQSKKIFRPLPEDDPKRRRPDIRLAKETLAWEPKVGLEEGLKKTVEYFHQVVK
ncbi:MAG: SDR family oxidoreductase [Candidatus Doudnabacteria bacterium]|nr:SDR family oxidoreductase [Candidatus Doudnabacteria bacterium]